MAVNATAIWRVRPSGSNTNGGGYDPGISGAATDYSQQNSAQATGTHGTTTGTTTFVDATANAFTSAMVGNAMYITGTGQTTGWYFVTAFSSASTVTLDRSPGTGTLATWNLGGGWADFWTNTTSSGPLVSGNTVYILGSGTPNPSSYTYDYTTSANIVGANNTTLYFANDPATPGYKAPPDTTGGMPVIKWNNNGDIFDGNSNGTGWVISGLWFVGTSTPSAGTYVLSCQFNSQFVFGCVFDQLSNDLGLALGGGTAGYTVMLSLGCEVFSSNGGSAGSHSAFRAQGACNNFEVDSCNIHDCVASGINSSGNSGFIAINNIVAKNLGDGINAFASSAMIKNNTVDGNGGNGIVSSGNLGFVYNNIITNHTTAGKYGLNTASPPNFFFDYNVFYNNTSNYNGTSAGPHDTALAVTPYVNSATENYQLA